MSIFSFGRKKSLNEKILKMLNESCRATSKECIIILSSLDGFMLGATTSNDSENINIELLAGLFTLVWKSGIKVLKNLGLGNPIYFLMGTENRNALIYNSPEIPSILLVIITEPNVSIIALKEVCERLAKKLSKLFNKL